jgi:hypothetical protein
MKSQKSLQTKIEARKKALRDSLVNSPDQIHKSKSSLNKSGSSRKRDPQHFKSVLTPNTSNK